jgi:hypothetical protein
MLFGLQKDLTHIEIEKGEKMSYGREDDWKKEADAETTEFLDMVLEYFQEDDERIEDFENWVKEKRKK